MVSSNEIRILDLLPQSGEADNAPIRCEIRTVSLASKPDYEALSYVWGDQTTLVDIEVSGQKVGVTQNLHDGLKRFRLLHDKRSLWIDQLCINQWDLKEKAEQVRLMRDIYTNCQSCQVWMGEVAEGIPLADAEQAVEFLKYMASAVGVEDVDSLPMPPSFDSHETFKGPMKALQSMSYELDIKRGNPWWARVWTVQEAVLPPEVFVTWGPLCFSWDVLYKATRPWVGDNCSIPWKVWELVSTPNTSFLGDMMAMIIWLAIAKEKDDFPVHMITRWRYREATDPRDKIYALLGLCHAYSLPAVETCNYDLPPVEVFCSLTIDLIILAESLLPLCMDPRLEPERATAGMPRWAIDVGDISEHNTDWYHIYSYSWYNACGNNSADLGALHARAQQGHKTLELTGLYVDTVEVVGERFHKPLMDHVEADPICIKCIKSWEALAKEHVKRGTPVSSEFYPGNYTRREAFARLLMGDLFRDGNQGVEYRARDEHIAQFYSYLYDGGEDNIRMTIHGMMKNQRFFITKTGLMGLGHLDTQPGDEVWVLYGGYLPFTLTPREGGSSDEYDFGGRCYVQGIMRGEQFGEVEDSNYESEDEEDESEEEGDEQDEEEDEGHEDEEEEKVNNVDDGSESEETWDTDDEGHPDARTIIIY